MQKQDDGRFYVETSKGTRFLTKTIFIAGGVGFVPARTPSRSTASRPTTTSRSSTASRTRRSSPARTW